MSWGTRDCEFPPTAGKGAETLQTPWAPRLRAWVRASRPSGSARNNRAIRQGGVCAQRPHWAYRTWSGIGGGVIDPTSGGLPGWQAWSVRGAAAWAELVAGMLWPGLGAGLCARVPVEGHAWAYLFILLHGEEQGPGDKL
ncbi:hypothetical protein NDU88_000740 [Pleurodeles waltl]|uniref:Uncharacterized protein n=1 Tax=Pleurodeles waltl TaxID=8319 RepID=A0AAV7UTY6_PLEWA|nr:hypothetical protein NDU88_000740 [Pleurodeles waltl]